MQLLGAGVETVINDPDIPTSVPLLRVADPLMGQRMATWVTIFLQQSFYNNAEQAQNSVHRCIPTLAPPPIR